MVEFVWRVTCQYVLGVTYGSVLFVVCFTSSNGYISWDGKFFYGSVLFVAEHVWQKGAALTTCFRVHRWVSKMDTVQSFFCFLPSVNDSSNILIEGCKLSIRFMLSQSSISRESDKWALGFICKFYDASAFNQMVWGPDLVILLDLLKNKKAHIQMKKTRDLLFPFQRVLFNAPLFW